MNWLKTIWARVRTGYPVFTHAVAAAILFLVGAYNEVPPFHDFVQSVYHSLPLHAQTLIAVAVALGIWYKQNRRTWTNGEREGARMIEQQQAAASATAAGVGK